MNKKIIGIVLALIVVAIIALLTMGMIASKNEEKDSMNTPVTEVSTKEMTVSPTIEQMKTYADPAGFEFNYPSTVTVTPKTITDKTMYADIEITSSSNPGSIRIVVKDETVSTTAQWMKQEGYAPKENEMKEVTLAGLKAVQFDQQSEALHSDIITTTALIDQKILFAISIEPDIGNLEATSTSQFWKEVNDTIVSSFAFVGTENTTTTPKQSSSPSKLGASDEIDEGVEEIIE